MSLPDGFYNCVVGNVERAEDQYNKGSYVGLIYCTFPEDGENETAVAKVMLADEEKATREFKALGLDADPWIAMDELEKCIGSQVRIQLKTSTKSGRQNAYIATGKPAKTLSKDDWKLVMARKKGGVFGDDDTPF